jgi:hypothetical protein
MPSPAAHVVYQACVRNLRAIDSARRAHTKFINAELLIRDNAHVHRLAKLQALLFSVWAEARFLKLLYTPHGYSEDELSSILRKRSLEKKWEHAVIGALRHVELGQRTRNDVRRRLNQLIGDYVIKPAELRNKLAHGQWEIALNNVATAVNDSRSRELDEITSITVDLWFVVFSGLADLAESLLESPTKEFARDYWGQIDRIENEIAKRRSWTIDTKRQLLIAKKKKFKLRSAAVSESITT